MRTRTIFSTAVLGLLSFAATVPAFAYFDADYNPDMRPARRSFEEQVRLRGNAADQRRMRDEAEQAEAGIARLRIREDRANLRNVNRHKLGTRRGMYRILNTQGDVRRRAGLESLKDLMPEAALPPSLVTTGRSVLRQTFDRPSRRSIKAAQKANFAATRS